MKTKQDLVARLRELKVVQRGSFRLSSGIHSDYKIDMEIAYGYPEIRSLIYRLISRDLDDRTTCIAGEGNGGLPLATGISDLLGMPLVLVKRAQELEDGKLNGYALTANDKVALVDDVFTTGRSFLKGVGLIQAAGAEVVGCYAIVKRNEGVGKFPVSLSYLIEAKDLR